MRLDYFLALDGRTLAVRYAVVTGLRVVWAGVLLPQEGASLAGYAVPNPLQIFELIPWLGQIAGAFTGAHGVNALPDYPLLVVQTFLLLGAVRLAVLHFRPELLANLPWFGVPAAQTTGDLDGLRLRRPWWVVPALMAGATFYTVSFLIGVVGGLVGRQGADQALRFAGNIPLWLSIALTVLGAIWGYRFNQSARQTVADHFSVDFLNDSHPLTLRVHALADRLALPRPSVGVVQEVNAFAVGSSPKDAAIVLGIPLVKNLRPEELDAVIGHELGHVISNDMRQMQFAVGYQRMFGQVFAVIALMLTQMAASVTKSRSSAMLAHSLGDGLKELGGTVLFLGGELMCKGLSRQREFYADAVGAGLTSPEAMAGALDRLASIRANPTPSENRYAYLMFKGGEGRFRPFATHPTTEQRKEALSTGAYVRTLPRRTP